MPNAWGFPYYNPYYQHQYQPYQLQPYQYQPFHYQQYPYAPHQAASSQAHQLPSGHFVNNTTMSHNNYPSCSGQGQGINTKSVGHVPPVAGRKNPGRQKQSAQVVDSDSEESLDGKSSQGSNDDMGDDTIVSEVDRTSNSSKINEYKEAHLVLGDMFPGQFYSRVQNLPYYRNPQGSDSSSYFKTPSNIPLLKISPDLTGSWFDAPDKEDLTDETSYWKASSKFPCKTRIVPVHCTLKAPPKNPYIHIVDDKLKLLFEAPVFSSVTLDHTAFDSPTIDLSRNPHTTLDALIRSSLLDTYTTDEYLKILLDLIPKISLESTPREDWLRYLDLAMDVIVMVAENNHRSGQTQLASYVSNKLALRDAVLSKFTSQNTSQNILRGSSFLSPGLFGELPESFKESLKLNRNKNLRFTRKPFSRATANSSYASKGFSKFNTKARKRPANFLPTTSNKRWKGTWNKNRKPFSDQQFFRAKNQKKN